MDYATLREAVVSGELLSAKVVAVERCHPPHFLGALRCVGEEGVVPGILKVLCLDRLARALEGCFELPGHLDAVERGTAIKAIGPHAWQACGSPLLGLSQFISATYLGTLAQRRQTHLHYGR